MTPDEVLTTTRSVRKRLDLERPVSMELVRECIEIALQAPSGSNRQQWAWIVVTDPVKRSVIADHYRRSYARYRGGRQAGGQQFPGDPTRAAVQDRVGNSSDWLAERMHDVPVLVIPCIRASRLPEGNQAGIWGSILPAAWSYMLAARTRGLGTCWTTLHLPYEAEVGELLGLPPEMRQAAMIPTAYYTGASFRRAPRRPLDEVLHMDGW